MEGGARSPRDELARVALLAGLDAAALDRLATAARPRTWSAGAVLVREGDPGDTLLVLRAGTARVVVHGRPRRDLGPGDLLGEIALLDRGPRSATVYAVDEVEALEVPGTALRELLEQDPRRYAVLVQALCERLRGLEQDRWADQEQARLRDLQDAFLANVGHELRTPLTTALGYLDIAIRKELPRERLVGALQTTLRGLRGLHGMVEDLIAEVRSRRGDAALRLDRYPLEVLVDGAVEASTLDPDRVQRELPEDLTLAVDADRATRCLVALLDNADKFGPAERPVRVTARATGDHVAIDVVDGGDGIPVEDREAIFELFLQRDPSSTRAAGGLGVGLAVARSTARAHGGDLGLVEDAPTTTFRLLLPQGGAPVDG